MEATKLILFSGRQSEIAKARAEFYSNFYTVKYQQVLERGIWCSACNQNPVCKEQMQLVPNRNGIPPTNCFKCRELFCRSPSCSVSMKTCDTCGKSSCGACNEVKQCDDASCKCHYCRDCNVFAFDPCMVCEKEFCQRCAPDILKCFKVNCNNKICNMCQEGEEPGEQNAFPLFSCSYCDQSWICQHCDEVSYCIGCGSGFCSDCYTGSRCVECDSPFCAGLLAFM